MEDLQINGRCIRLVTPDEQALLEALYQHKDGGAIARVLAGILDRLREARAKHGRFAEQVYHALSFLSEEHGEVVREITKSKDGWEKRMDSELLDLVAVAMRMLLREYEHGGGRMSRKKTPCPAERWEHDAMAWKAVAKRLAKLCADLVGCCFDEERTCPEGMACSSCWLNRAVRETARKEPCND